MEDQVKAWIPYAEEIRVIRVTCAFCSNEEDHERSDFNDATKEEVLKMLADEGWKELTSDSVEGLACRACVEELKQ